MAVHEDACQIKFTTWPTTGVTVTNEGRTGTTYNGTAGDNDYLLQPSGATSFSFDDVDHNDIVIVPAGAITNNLGAHTLEFYIDLHSYGATPNQLFNKAGFYYCVVSNITKNLLLTRFDTGGANFKQWDTPTDSLSLGPNYIQIAWDATLVSNDPIIKINGVTQTLTTGHSGVTTAWKDDSAGVLQIGNRTALNRELLAAFSLVRLHNRVLTPTELIDNYNCDKWRMETELQYDFSQDATPILNDINPSVYPMTLSGLVKKEGADGACHCYTLSGGTNCATVPKGTATDNLKAHTLEFIFYYKTFGNSLLFAKGNLASFAGYNVNININGVLAVGRFDVGGVAYKAYVTAAGSCTVGNTYHVQVAWDATNVDNPPVVKINGVTKTLTTAHSGVTTAWYNDSTTDLYLGNIAALNKGFIGSLYLFRLYQRVLTEGELTFNYQKEQWRYSSDAGCDLKYDFSEETGVTVANDITPGTYNLTLSGPTKYEAGYGGAHYYRFDGTDDYAVVACDANLDNVTSHTLEFIINTVARAKLVWTKGIWAAGTYFGVAISAGGLVQLYRETIGGGADYASWVSTAVLPSAPTHVIITQDGANPTTATATLYFNGVPQTFTKTYAGASVTWFDDSAYDMRLADDSAAFAHLAGDYYFFRYYKRVLSAAEALEAYNQEKWRYSDTGLTLTIDKHDYSCFIRPSTFSVIDQLEGRNTGSFETIHPINPKHGTMGQPIIVTHNDTKLYEGLITAVTKQEISDVSGYHYQYKIADYTTFATRRLIAWNYEDMSADDIVLHINTYFLAGEGLSAVKVASGGYVEAGITLAKAVFNYVTVAAALDQLAEQCGYSWYIDYDKNLHFFARTSNVAPWNIYDGRKNYSTFNSDTTQDQYRNRQWIQGGNQLSEPRTETFLGDSKLTSFKLMYQVAKVPTITVNGVAQTAGIQSVDEDKDWFWSDSSDTITQAQKYEAYRDYATVEYDFTENTGTVLKNKTEHAIGCDATTYENDYMAISTGAGHWRFDLAADYIKIPHDIPIDNVGPHTFEWIVYIGSFQTDARLWDKSVHVVYIDETNKNLIIYRSGTGGGYKQYSTPTNTFAAGKYYHIQIVWDATVVTNPPVIYINGVKQALTDGSVGTVWAFDSDSSYDAYIGNRAAYDRWFDGAFLLFRLWRKAALPVPHELSEEEQATALITEDQLKGNYYAEKWRYSTVARGVPLTQKQKLSVIYQYRFPIIDVVDNAANQATQAALEATGSGIYETIENDGTLDETAWALDKATRLLAKYGPTAETIKFATNRTGLKAGQLINVTLPDLYVNNVAYLITEVELADEEFVQYEYTVTASSGESLGSWAKFFTDEAATGRTFKINEGQTLLLLTKSLESLTVTDALSQTKGTPAHRAKGVSGNATIAQPHQGIATDGVNFYGFDTTAIYKYDLNWNLVASHVTAGAEVGVAHIGGGDCYGGVLYAACCDIGPPITNACIGKWNATTLAYIGKVDISAEFNGNIDPSGCGVDTTNSKLWVCSFYTGNTICNYDLTTLAYEESITPNPPITMAPQDIKYQGGMLYIAYCDTTTVLTGGVFKMNTSGTDQHNVVLMPVSEIEGLIVTSTGLYVHVWDWGGGHADIYHSSWAPVSPTAVGTNCQVKYSTWPPTGVTITNEGVAGAGYNGAAADNDYLLQPSDATSFVYDNTTDVVIIPAGAAINNPTTTTWEFVINISSLAVANDLLTKYGFFVSVDTAGKIQMRRYDDGAVAYRLWYSAAGTIATGTNYHIQITWDMTGVAATPILYVNNVVTALTAAHSGVTDAWVNDSAHNAYLGSREALDQPLVGTIYTFRWHNVILTPSQLTTNYYADYWRYTPTPRVGFSECTS
jgi:hypothetical protein